MAGKQDSIYANALDEIIDFRFDEKVVDVFPDMIQRSVPGYATLISTIGILAGQYAQTNSHCYDLGCSLGAVSLSMRQRIKQAHCDIIAIDNSQEMIDKAKILLAKEISSTVTVELRCSDIQDVVIEQASVVVMNFTLQFIKLHQRFDLIRNIYNGLKPGGAFILSEKIAFNNQAEQDFHTESHHAFKRDNGYSDLEISQKRTALENVLIPETLQAHTQRILDAGFSSVTVWFQCFNFISLIAVK